MTKVSWERASSNSTNIGAAAANWAEVRKEFLQQGRIRSGMLSIRRRQETTG